MENIIRRFNGIKVSQDDKDKKNENKEWMYSGIIIPPHIKSVPSIDKVNTVFCEGGETELYSKRKPYTIEEYKEKYSYIGSDNKLYWKEENN